MECMEADGGMELGMEVLAGFKFEHWTQSLSLAGLQLCQSAATLVWSRDMKLEVNKATN
jgi:hypothetical protein